MDDARQLGEGGAGGSPWWSPLPPQMVTLLHNDCVIRSYNNKGNFCFFKLSFAAPDDSHAVCRMIN